MSTLTLMKQADSKVDSKLRAVTPENAKHWLANSIWNNQRKFREYHADRLAEAMARGEFIEGTQIHFAKLDGVIHNVNGQHTLHAIVKAGKTIQLTVLTTVVKSEKEIADLYGRHDQHLKRTASDSFRAHDLANANGMNDYQVNMVGAAAKVIIDNFNTSNRRMPNYAASSLDERVRVFNEYGPAASEYLKTVYGAPVGIGKALRAGSVMAVALRTFKESPAKAKEFWSQVAFCDGLVIGDPRKTLMTWLLSNPVTRNNQPVRSRVVANAWNVFVAGGSMTKIRAQDWTKPIEIAIAA